MSLISFSLKQNQNINSSKNILEIYNSNMNEVEEITPEMDSKTMVQVISDKLIEIMRKELLAP